MTKISTRGFNVNDKRWFSVEEIIKLKKAHEEIKWLLDRNYKIEPTINFVGDRYQFSTRQRDALKRSSCSSEKEFIRKSKELPIKKIENNTLNIDGFNLIITLEVALSKGTLIIGNDNNIRDLAGLRGTYKLIDKTYLALDLLFKIFNDSNVKSVNFYLDSPVSNSGNLKIKILEYATKWNIPTDVQLFPNADIILEKLENVISSDAVILDKCKSSFNLHKYIIDNFIPLANLIYLS